MKTFQKAVGLIGMMFIVILFGIGFGSVAFAATISTGDGFSPAAGILVGSALALIGLAVYSENNYLADIVLDEEEIQGQSRDIVTVKSGQNLKIGTVLGRILLGAVSETHAGNTGNGAMTIDATTPLLAFARAGIYKAVCIAAATNAGTFRIYDPEGNVLGDVDVGGTFANQIKFAIADGSTDFIVGDTFLITVAEGSKKVKILDPSAIDGTQYAYGVLCEAIDATSADKKSSAIVREAVLKSAGLIWPDGITADEKAAALDAFAKLSVTVRTGA